MPDPEGVDPSATPADTDPTEPDVVPAAAFSAVDDEQLIEGRPLKNIIAELDRKAAQRAEQLRAELLAAVTATQRQPVQPTQREYSDEELSQLATAGDSRALQMLTDRQSQRHVTSQVQAQAQSQAEAQQLVALFGRYPVLRDTSHGLTHYAMQVKGVLLQRGYANNAATEIEAIKTAIADNPELAAQSAVRAPSAPRPTVPQAQAAAPSPRRTSAPATKVEPVSDAEFEVAKRMGFKTREAVAKAKVNFRKRQEDGTSRLGAVGMHVNVREDA